MNRRAIHRILDANINRAQEGLRVCEELARFLLNDRPLTDRLRRMRHGLVAATAQLSVRRSTLIAARDSRRDVGRLAPDVRADHPRSPETTALANLARAKESLRVLEEYAKLLSPQAALAFSRLRFRAYAAEQDLLERLASLRHPRSNRRARARSGARG